MKHKHADMIKAKADNIDLVAFVKREGKEWMKIVCVCSNANEIPAFYESYEYFICHPKHTDVCLHWLNGGEVSSDCHPHNWGELTPTWSEEHPFMDDSREFRIKPRKEKRWIGIYRGEFVTEKTTGTLQDAQEYVLSNPHYKHCAPECWQFIQIEFEV